MVLFAISDIVRSRHPAFHLEYREQDATLDLLLGIIILAEAAHAVEPSEVHTVHEQGRASHSSHGQPRRVW